MKSKIILIAMLATLAFGLISTNPLLAQKEEKHNVIPEKGYVPDEDTAIKIAIAVWIPIYGKEKIENEKPYIAELKDNVWYVQGSLPKQKGMIMVGGVAIAEIDKKTGAILRISHGK
jgi:hypothetical protein